VREMVCCCLFTLSYDGAYTPRLVDLVVGTSSRVVGRQVGIREVST
jgi:hypothetical protein